MSEIKVGDWFNFTERARPDLREDGPYKAEYVSSERIGYTSAHGGMTFALHGEVEPYMPKLKKSMESSTQFAETEEDRLMVETAEFIERVKTGNIDEERAHSMEDRFKDRAWIVVARGEARFPERLAQRMVELSELDFGRWYG